MMFYCFCEYINYLIGNLLCEVKLSNEILFFVSDKDNYYTGVFEESRNKSETGSYVGCFR